MIRDEIEELKNTVRKQGKEIERLNDLNRKVNESTNRLFFDYNNLRKEVLDGVSGIRLEMNKFKSEISDTPLVVPDIEKLQEQVKELSLEIQNLKKTPKPQPIGRRKESRFMRHRREAKELREKEEKEEEEKDAERSRLSRLEDEEFRRIREEEKRVKEEKRVTRSSMRTQFPPFTFL